MLQRSVTAVQVGNAEQVEAAVQTTILQSEGERLTRVVALREFVVAGSEGGSIRVYDRDTSSAARAVFSEHNNEVVRLVRLEDDLVVSVDWDGQIFTWRPSTTETIGSWKADEGFRVRTVAKLDDNQLVVGTLTGDLAILSHSCGANLRLEKIFMRRRNSVIRRFFVSNNLVVSSSGETTVTVWDKNTFSQLATLQAAGLVYGVAVSDAHIVLVCTLGRIYVYRNTPPYALDLVLQTPCRSLFSVICLNADVVAVTGETGCVSFVSLANKSLVARVQVSNGELTSLAVLSDNRLAVAGLFGVCTLFHPPQRVQHTVNEYTTNMYYRHTILNAWKAVEQESLSIVDACESVIKSENTSRCLDEWCMAHHLLMQAVNTGVIARSRNYNGIKLYWHRELYKHCDKLAIGERDISVLISLFQEAEGVGVIAEGTSELFITAVDIRSDIEKSRWYSANAIYHLFLRQAETDERLKQLFLKQAETDTRMQKVLHYQKVQRFTSMINAVLGFIPIGGSIAANAISGGAAILNDFQVCGLVESLLGVGKELTGGFRSDKLVDMFLRRGNQVLSAEHWEQWEEDNRRAVEDAARTMGLTVDELRVMLLRAAEKMNDAQEKNETESATEVVEIVEKEETESCLQLETSSSEATNAPLLVVSKLEVNELDLDLEGARLELARWANEPVNKESVETLKDEEAASCLAAFLVNYSKRQIANYIRLRDALLNVFVEQFIDGSLFVHADGKEREELIQSGMSAIGTVVESRASRNLSIRLRLFLQQVLES